MQNKTRRLDAKHMTLRVVEPVLVFFYFRATHVRQLRGHAINKQKSETCHVMPADGTCWLLFSFADAAAQKQCAAQNKNAGNGLQRRKQRKRHAAGDAQLVRALAAHAEKPDRP